MGRTCAQRLRKNSFSFRAFSFREREKERVLSNEERREEGERESNVNQTRFTRAFLTPTLDFEQHCSSECRTHSLHGPKGTCLRKCADTLLNTNRLPKIYNGKLKNRNSMFSYFVLIVPVLSRWKSFLPLPLTRPRRALLLDFTTYP